MTDAAGVPSSVLARAALILHAFTEDYPDLDLAELTRRCGLPRSTTHRLAAELIELRLLSRSPRGRYTIGTGLWELGELSPLSMRLRETALPHLARLYETTGENVHLAILDGVDTLYVERITGHRSVPLLSRMGGRAPLHVTGVGRAILATRDEGWLADYFTAPLERETTFSIVDEQALRADITATRDRGYAITRQEMTLGNSSIAAALPTIPELPQIAIGVVTHLKDADEGRLAPLVMRSAHELGEALRQA
jgi:DNA-binding IclR family transcriptional regulator